ncbi:MAG: hypothetical protein H6916_04550 [Novosphingobium sp.]|uniref:hypothetical protein n=1 Tax=Novosphingobium sp. TaxID=1874826 RepID=UPI002604077D|nr:hypothetical protein [Novosphingobium sp.]MCP5386073.1 hypothetical protein [Novosphingobium sp.]
MMRHAPLAVPLLLAACGQSGEEAAQPTAAPSLSATAAPSAAAVPEPLDSRDPRKVLAAWAQAVSLGQWDAAYLYWGERGEASGMNLAQFRARWGKLGTPELELREGQAEGAAGSLYYTAPVTIIAGPRRIEGEVVLKRVNDVPGASAEQLRWHIESTSFDF